MPNANTPIMRGSCLCQAVQYQLHAPFTYTSHCHCTQCQKQHGAAFGSYGNVPLAAFTVVQGQDAIRHYSATPGILRSFCAHCGSTLTWHDTQRTEATISVTLGTLDSPYREQVPKVEKHIFTDTRAAWC